MSIEKALGALTKLNAPQTYDRIKDATKVDEHQYDVSEREAFANKVVEFNFFVKKCKPFLDQMKTDLAGLLTNKADCLAAYKGVQKIYEYYEDLNMSHYVDMQSTLLILNNPENTTLKDSMTHLNSNLRNSFVEVYHWVQGELYDISSIVQAVASRAQIEKDLVALQKKKQSTQKDIDDLNAGNKSVGTVFKNKEDIPKLTAQVEELTKEIQHT